MPAFQARIPHTEDNYCSSPEMERGRLAIVTPGPSLTCGVGGHGLVIGGHGRMHVMVQIALRGASVDVLGWLAQVDWTG